MKPRKTIVYKENEWSLGKISNSRGIDGCLSSLSKIHSFIDQCNWYCSFSFCNVCSTTFVNTQNKSSFVCIQKISCYHIFFKLNYTYVNFRYYMTWSISRCIQLETYFHCLLHFCSFQMFSSLTCI